MKPTGKDQTVKYVTGYYGVDPADGIEKPFIPKQVGDKIEYFFKGDEYNEPCHDCMTVKLLKDLSEGEFFKTTPADHNKNVMVRGEFDRSQGKYFAEGYFNGKETCLNGNKVVFTDFIC